MSKLTSTWEVAHPVDGREREAAQRGVREARRCPVQAAGAQAARGRDCAGPSPTRPPQKTFDEVADHWLKVRPPASEASPVTSRSSEPISDPRSAGSAHRTSTKQTPAAEGVEGSAAPKHPPPHPDTAHLAVPDSPGPRLAPGDAEGGEAEDQALRRDFHYLGTKKDVRFLRSAKEEGELEFVLSATALYTACGRANSPGFAGRAWTSGNGSSSSPQLERTDEKRRGAAGSGHRRLLLSRSSAWQLRSPGKFVFPNSEGSMFAKSARVFQESLHSILDRAGFPTVERHGRSVATSGFMICATRLRPTG